MLKGTVLIDISCSSFVVHVRLEAALWLTYRPRAGRRSGRNPYWPFLLKTSRLILFSRKKLFGPEFCQLIFNPCPHLALIPEFYFPAPGFLWFCLHGFFYYQIISFTWTYFIQNCFAFCTFPSWKCYLH